ncbi:MAG: Smr/MutS family protein, partial [Halocynthiibacter sp.]
MSRKRRQLRPEEEALWKRVAETAIPLVPAKTPDARAELITAVRTSAATQKEQRDKIAHFALGQVAPRQIYHHSLPAVTSGQRLARQPLQMDGKAFARLQRGKLKPEARIDLHGMTLAEAHPALIGFVLGAHSAHRRLVLVIT